MSVGDPSISVDLGTALPFLWDKFLAMIGKDTATRDLQHWFTELQRVGLADASTVQCIGMHTPLPLQEIYRPTRLMWLSRHLTITNSLNERTTIALPSDPVSPNAFLDVQTSAIISAGPGWGKTTFLHYLLLHFSRSRNRLPLLITLRRPGSIADLTKLVDALGRAPKLRRNLSVLLLVDGYDEISLEARRKVSVVLNKFIATGTGRLYLSCREFYDIYDLKLPSVKVAPFSVDDQKHFVASFSKAYGTQLNPDNMIPDLSNRGLADLLEHPLLLALVCIVKSSSISLHSTSVLVLIERALDALSFRWDEGKGISREQRIPLDGRSRIHCLMRIAYKSNTPQVRDRVVLEGAREQLAMLRWEDLDEKQVMLETARFYGILVPTGGNDWEFVHKTLHDYLAARFMIETGAFRPDQIRDWNARLAYAACLSPDATKSMEAALRSAESFPAFVEMLSNDAPFDHGVIANALIRNYEEYPRRHFFEAKDPGVISVQLSADFIRLASSKFLQDLCLVCTTARGRARDTFFGYAATELVARHQRLTKTNYSQAYRLYGPDVLFKVNRGGGWRSLRMNELTPA